MRGLLQFFPRINFTTLQSDAYHSYANGRGNCVVFIAVAQNGKRQGANTTTSACQSDLRMKQTTNIRRKSCAKLFMSDGSKLRHVRNPLNVCQTRRNTYNCCCRNDYRYRLTLRLVCQMIDFCYRMNLDLRFSQPACRPFLSLWFIAKSLGQNQLCGYVFTRRSVTHARSKAPIAKLFTAVRAGYGLAIDGNFYHSRSTERTRRYKR